MAFGFRRRHDWGRPVVRAPDDQAVSVGIFGLGHAAVVAVRARRNARFTTLSLPVFPLHHQGFDSFPLSPACVACRHVAVWWDVRMVGAAGRCGVGRMVGRMVGRGIGGDLSPSSLILFYYFFSYARDVIVDIVVDILGWAALWFCRFSLLRTVFGS